MTFVVLSGSRIRSWWRWVGWQDSASLASRARNVCAYTRGMTSIRFDPWRNLDKLPQRAPIRCHRASDWPRPRQVRPRLEREGIDPDSASAILSALLHRGWGSWLIASPGPRPSFRAYVLEHRYGAVWAMGDGATPAEAYGAALVCCLDEPPWEKDDGDG